MTQYKISRTHVSIRADGKGGQVAGVILMGHEARPISDLAGLIPRDGISEHYQIPITSDIRAADDLNKEVVRRAIAMSPNNWISDNSDVNSPIFIGVQAALGTFAASQAATVSRSHKSVSKATPSQPTTSRPSVSSAPPNPAPRNQQVPTSTPVFKTRIYSGWVIAALDVIAIATYGMFLAIYLVPTADQAVGTFTALVTISFMSMLIGTIGLMIADWRGFWFINDGANANSAVATNDQQVAKSAACFYFSPLSW